MAITAPSVSCCPALHQATGCRPTWRCLMLGQDTALAPLRDWTDTMPLPVLYPAHCQITIRYIRGSRAYPNIKHKAHSCRLISNGEVCTWTLLLLLLLSRRK